MTNGLEGKVTDGVRAILSKQHAYAAKALAEAGNYHGARAALDAFARKNKVYEYLRPSLEGLAVSDEATKRAAELYGRQWNETIDNSTILDFLSYLEVSEGYNLLSMSEGGRRLLGIKMRPIKNKTIGALKKELDEAYELIENVEGGNIRESIDSQVENAYRVINTNGILLGDINLLINLNNSALQQRAIAKSSQETAKMVERRILGLRPERD